MYLHLVAIGIAATFLDSQDWFVGSVLHVGTDDMLVDMDVFGGHIGYTLLITSAHAFAMSMCSS